MRILALWMLWLFVLPQAEGGQFLDACREVYQRLAGRYYTTNVKLNTSIHSLLKTNDLSRKSNVYRVMRREQLTQNPDGSFSVEGTEDPLAQIKDVHSTDLLFNAANLPHPSLNVSLEKNGALSYADYLGPDYVLVEIKVGAFLDVGSIPYPDVGSRVVGGALVFTIPKGNTVPVKVIDEDPYTTWQNIRRERMEKRRE